MTRIRSTTIQTHSMRTRTPTTNRNRTTNPNPNPMTNRRYSPVARRG
jgi:hypothetical protein